MVSNVLILVYYKIQPISFEIEEKSLVIVTFFFDLFTKVSVVFSVLKMIL